MDENSDLLITQAMLMGWTKSGPYHYWYRIAYDNEPTMGYMAPDGKRVMIFHSAKQVVTYETRRATDGNKDLPDRDQG
jgi:hypothetical protein